MANDENDGLIDKVENAVWKVSKVGLTLFGFYALYKGFEFFRTHTNQYDASHSNTTTGSDTGVTRMDTMSEAEIMARIKALQKEKHFFLFNTLIVEGETTIIAAPAEFGKTYLMLEIPKSPHVKKMLCIAWDKRRASQEMRFLKADSHGKMMVSYKEDKDSLISKIKSEAGGDSTFQAFGDTFIVPLGKFRERRKQYLHQYGLKNEKTIDVILALEILLSLPVVKGCNVAALDTLNAVMEHPSKFTRGLFNRIVDAMFDNGMTPVIFHHMEKSHKSMVGAEEIMNVPENVIFLSRGKDRQRILTERKAGNRPNKMRVTYDMFYAEEDKADIRFISAEEIDDDGEGEVGKPGRKAVLRGPIISFTKTIGITSFDALWEHLQTMGFSNKRSVYTALEEMERDGVILREGDGWNQIRLNNSDDFNTEDSDVAGG